MRALLDENLPRALAGALTGHQVTTVQAADWAGTKNGELLRCADNQFYVLLTMDRRLRYRQNLNALRLSIVIVRAPSNRMVHLKPLVGRILKALEELQPGQRGRSLLRRDLKERLTGPLP